MSATKTLPELVWSEPRSSRTHPKAATRPTTRLRPARERRPEDVTASRHRCHLTRRRSLTQTENSAPSAAHKNDPMIERELDVATGDGAMNTFVTHPEEGGPFPLVIFYMDAPGKREELHDMARRIATVGYFVALPNLYYRQVREFHLGMPGATRERMFELMGGLSNAMVCADTQAILDFAAGEEAAADGGIGAVGYCMSGPFVFAAAAEFAGRIKAAASLHGVRLCTTDEDSPHKTAHRIGGEIYFGCAETDQWAPPEMIEELDKHLAAAGVNYRIEWYPGTGHGFVFPQREGMYHKASAERHWERLFALFGRNL